jgi:hypothetical protein
MATKRNNLGNIRRLIETSAMKAPVNEAFIADLNTAIEMMDKKNKRKPSQSYKPSSMKCIRNMFYQVTGAEQDQDRRSASFVGIGESGTDRHLRIQEAVTFMKEFGMDCEYVDVGSYVTSHNLNKLEITSKKQFETHLIHKDLNASFLCDGIILYKGHYYILEIKTEASFKWQQRTDVAEEHYNQAIMYSVCLGIDDVIFVYENRDTCDKKAFLFQVTDEMKYSKIISRIEECDSYVKKLIVPPKPADVTKKTCQYC